MKTIFPSQSKTNRNILALFLVLLSHSSIVAQTENTILNPKFFDEFIGYQVLDDSAVRIIAKSDQNNGYAESRCAITDYQFTDSLSSANPYVLIPPDAYFNYAIEYLYMLPMRDGSTILANSQWECDYDPPGGIVAIDAESEIMWLLDLRDEFEYYTGGEMSWVDSGTILVQRRWENEKYLITTDGELGGQTPLQSDFDTIIQTPSGFIASLGNELLFLDNSIVPLEWYQLPYPIETIHTLTNNEFLVSSTNRYYRYTSKQELEELPIDKSVYGVPWRSRNYYWMTIKSNGDMLKMDTFFQTVDTLDFPSAMQPVAGLSFDTSFILIAEYITPSMRGIVLWKGDEEVFDPALPQDMGVTDVIIPDSVTVYHYQNPWESGYNHDYPSVRVSVQNFGMDTITHFTLHLNLYGECHSFCSDRQSIWEIDSLTLAPQQSAYVDLGSITIPCYYEANVDFCISTLAPNQLADGNFDNDRHCQFVTPNVIVSTQPIAQFELAVYPNPANDQITLINEGNWTKADISSITGVRLKGFALESSTANLDVSDLKPGLYVLAVYNNSGDQQYIKLVIQ